MKRSMPMSEAPGTARGGDFIAPTGGWNARDPIANMPASDALYLDNMVPRTSDVQLRLGYELFATLPTDTEPGSPHNVRSLMPYSPPSAVTKLFAGLEDGIYDISSGGVVSSIASSATNSKWQFLNVTTSGGSFLWCCNGVDKCRYYNGSAWTVLDGASSPSLTGITSQDVTNVSLHKARMYLCKKDSLSFYYLAAASVAGVATEYPMGAIFKRGGYLVATESWTLDGGSGMDDLFVAITSEGEVAVFEGTDPSSSNTWALKGLYYIGEPIGRRCFCRIGGDLAVLTVSGLYPLSKALMYATVDKRSAVSDKISRAWIDYTRNYKDNYGWQAVLFPAATLLIVNVPILDRHDLNAYYSYQFVMNTQTGAWCRFLGQHAEVWAVYNGELYFAVHNKVYKAWTGATDGGGAIDGRVKTAFAYPAGKNNLAQITLARPIIQSNGNLQLQVAIDANYDESSQAFSTISYANNLALWDSGLWDTAVWSVGNRTVAEWRSISHNPGRALSFRMKVRSLGISMTWITTETILRKGGLL